MNANRLALAISLCLILQTFLAAAPQDQQTDSPVTGTDVFSVALQGGDPGPGPGIFIPPMGGSGNPGPGPSGGQVPTINLGKLFPKSGDPCAGHFTPVSDRQYFEMAAHPNQWLCAANGISPGIHRVCADLKELPKQCYDPNHPSRLVLHLVQNCLNGNSQCGHLLQQENCADIYRFQAELQAGVSFPAPGRPETALQNWTPLYLARLLPTLIGECRTRGFLPPTQRAPTSGTPTRNSLPCAIDQLLNSCMQPAQAQPVLKDATPADDNRLRPGFYDVYSGTWHQGEVAAGSAQVSLQNNGKLLVRMSTGSAFLNPTGSTIFQGSTVQTYVVEGTGQRVYFCKPPPQSGTGDLGMYDVWWMRTSSTGHPETWKAR